MSERDGLLESFRLAVIGSKVALCDAQHELQEKQAAVEAAQKQLTMAVAALRGAEAALPVNKEG